MIINMKREKQKLKILYLKEILLRETDENHLLSASQLCNKLSSYGIEAGRKSIYKDIEAMRDAGLLDVSVSGGRFGGAKVLSRNFELAELKILVDAVQASRFISKKHCASLIKKLTSLASIHEEKQLSRSVYVYDRPDDKSSNILYLTDALHSAISENTSVTFRYTDITPSKKRVQRHGELLYKVSPWALVWREENYYLVAYNHLSCSIRHYRVDRMEDISHTGEARLGYGEFSKISLSSYCSKVFEMFNGKEYNVRFRCENRLAGAMFDRFGKALIIEEMEGYFEFYAQVEVSVRFYGWVFGFDGALKIISPEEVVSGYQAQLHRVLSGTEKKPEKIS